jgi:hypothetical protein
MKRLIVLVSSFSSILAAQTAGVLPEWEVRDAAAALVKHIQVVDGLLSQLKPEDWAARGASSLYVDQWKQTKQANTYLGQQAQALADRPDKLSLALDVFLRLDYIHSLLESLTEGVRAHQNAALADLLAAAVSQNSTTREKLKEYARELAVEREKEWEIANREAQRCRATLAKRPPAPPAKKPSKP